MAPLLLPLVKEAENVAREDGRTERGRRIAEMRRLLLFSSFQLPLAFRSSVGGKWREEKRGATDRGELTTTVQGACTKGNG